MLWPIVAARIAPAVRPLCGKASLGWDFIASTPNSEMSFQTTGDLCMAATNMVVAFHNLTQPPLKSAVRLVASVQMPPAIAVPRTCLPDNEPPKQ